MLMVSVMGAAVLALVLAGGAADDATDVVASYIWGPRTPLQGERAPEVIPFLDGHGLRFVKDGRTEVNLSQVDGDRLRLTGPFTLCAVVQLTAEPPDKRGLVSKWETQNGRRSWELGVNEARRAYLAVSSSGDYDEHARELFCTRPLRLGQPYAIAAVFVPGQRMALYVNGVPSGEMTEGVPGPAFDCATPVLLGARPPGVLHVDALIGPLSIHSRALAGPAIAAWAKQSGLTQDPEPEILTFDQALLANGHELPPVRAITHGPKFHWFAYYDKLQIDPSGRYCLGMEVDFEHRSPRPEDSIKIGMVDLHDNDRWIELGESRAWCWQQGCMLQWRPGSATEVLWNDREGGRFVCRMLDVTSREMRTLPYPVYHVNPDGKLALGVDFARINHMRPGYGYAGIDDPNRDVLAPDDSGIYTLDLDTGEQRLLFSIADVSAIPYPDPKPDEDKHYFNHIQWSPDGTRFLFLNRWRSGGKGGFRTRMFTAAADGSDIRLVTDKPGISHYVWRDPEQILIHRGAYRLYRDDGSGNEALLFEAPNGHESYLPDLAWIVTDTYPMGKRREQHLYLLHVPAKRVVPLGHFASPPEYRGEWRCDLHPRVGPDGDRIIIDSTHGGEGRQLYLIDLTGVIEREQASRAESGR